MKYLKLKFLLMFFALAMAIPPAWAETATLPGTQALTTSYANVGDDPNIQIKISSSNTYTNPLRFYANTTTTIKAVEGYAIQSVTYEASQAGNYVTIAQQATVTPNVTPTVDGKNVTWTLANVTEFTFTPSSQTRANSITINYVATGGTPACAMPTFSVPAGTYYEPKSVSISCATEGATIHYTTNGDTPDENSAIYSTPITVDESMTIKAIAMKDGYSNSEIAEAAYEIIDTSTLTTYRKITSTSELTNGDYLIVCEDTNVAFDGSLNNASIDGSNNNFSVNPQDGVIRTDKAGYFTIKAISGSQQRSIRSASGVAIGRGTASNGMDHTTDGDQVYPNTITFDNGNAVISGEGSYVLRYNADNGQTRFRYYNGTNKPIQLYKKDSNNPVITVEPEDGLIINDATGDNKTGTLTATVEPAGEIIAETTSGWSANVDGNSVTYDGKALHAKGTVTYKSTDADDVDADLEYNYTGPLYIMGTVNNGSWSANNMVDLEGPDADGIYTATFTSAAGDEGKSWISFSKRKGTYWDSWNDIKDYRFTPLGDTPYTAYWLNENQLGTWIGFDFDPDHVDSQPLRMDPGTYTITIDAKNNQFKIERYQQTVETPTFSVAEGTYETDQTVSISCATDGATIHYTLDGSDPDANSAVYSTPLTVSATTTIKAIAMKEGWTSSAIASATYTINKPVTYVKVTSTDQIVVGKRYIFVQEASQDVSAPQAMGAIGSNNYGTGIPVTINDNKVVAPADVLVFTLYGTEGSYKFVDKDGKYLRGSSSAALSLGSDANNAAWILNNNNNALSGYRARNAQYDSRSIKWHHTNNRFNHYANSDVNSSFTFIYVEDDGTTPVVQTVDTPVITPGSGTYTETQTVTITCATEGAAINYKIGDGDYQPYSAPFEVSESCTIYAKATKTGMDDSEVAEATYTIIYNVNNLAEAKALKDDQEFNFTGDVVVTFKQSYNNGTHTLIGLRDNNATEGGGVFHNAKASIYSALEKGNVLNPGWTADKETHEGWIQFEDINNVTTAENTVEVLPFDRTGQTLTTANQSEYIILNNVTINGTTATTSGGSKATYTLFDLFNNDETVIADGQYKSLVGVVGVNGETVYVYPLELTAKQNPELSFAQETYTTYLGNAFAGQIVTNPHEVTPISYTSSNPEAVEVNAETGAVTIKAVTTEPVTITAIFEGNDDYMAANVSYTITVKAKEAAGLAFVDEDSNPITDPIVINATVGDDITEPTVFTNGLSVSYSSDPESVATVDKNGNVTIEGPGTATITISTEGDETHSGGYISYTINAFAKVATPTFSPEPQEEAFTTPQSVTIACATEGAKIYYNINSEANPTAESTLYEDAITVGDGTTTIKAIAIAEGMTDSEVATATYTVILPTLAAPVITPESGEKNNAVEVTITPAEGAKAYYMLNDAQEWTEYTEPFTVDGNEQTIKAIAKQENYKDSPEATATYTFAIAPLTFTPAAGTFNAAQNVEIATETKGAKIEYSINDGEWTEYTGAITVGENTTIKARATKDGYTAAEEPASATYVIELPVVAAPTFTPEPGSYTEGQTVTIACPTEGAVVSYSTDGGNNWTQGNTVTVNEDMTLMAKAVMNGVETTANAVYSFEFPVEPINIEALEGYYQIKNNGNGKYAYVQGRRTLTFTDAPADKAGTVIYVKTDGHGQVQSLRSQAADLQGYADKAMNYVPELVHLVAQKLETEGVGELFGETGVDAILAKFNESFDHHLYVEPADGGYRIYGKTPSMQPVVEFYRENQAKVDAKLPMLEDAINNAIDKILEKTNGSGGAILTKFSVDTIWKHMNNPYLIEPVDDASTMAFYHQVLMNKDYVWSFAYETAMIYWTNLKNHPRYENEIKPQLGEFAEYLEKIEQVRPNFKYYIAQKNDKPDFISQGNVDVDAARNIWTVVPRDKFTVNVPEANKVKDGYVTTLYTDFAYTLPEDVTAYKVTAVDENGYATTEAIGNAVPAQTPILLKATAAGDKELTLNPASRAEIEGNLLKGPDYLIGEYQIKNPTVEKMFNLVKSLFGEEIYNRYMLDYEHLMLRYAGLMNNKYFWKLSDEEIESCVYLDENNEAVCVIRSLDVEDGEVAFYNNTTMATNKAFLVSTTHDKILLEQPEVAAPTFTPEPGSYTAGQTVTITCPTEGAVVSYSTDGGNTWTQGNTVTVNEDMTLMAKAVMNGVETTANAVYSFEFPVTIPTIEALEGYYLIKNNGNGMYANVEGRKTLTFTDAPDDKAGTVIYVKTDDKGQVQSLRSQAADLQGYADKAMNYVPELVHLVADKLEVEGVGSLFGENGVDAILDKFNEGFDHHLYVEEAEGGYRIYGKTPSMQHVVEFYRENQAKVDAKLPLLETAINNAIQKILEKTNGSGAAILTPFSVDTVWKHMNNPYLIEPVDEASTMAFYHQVLMNKDFVWSFAYETAMIYWNNLKNHDKYESMIKPQLGEFAEYLEKIEQVRPNFKYYIAQKNGKPDFISQGNVDVNADRNIWTVVPRDKFTVNIAGEMFGCPYAGGLGGYVTSLYTDFAYTLPDDVTAYKVTTVDENGQAELTALEGVVPAQTPVLLIAKEEGDYSLTLSTEAGTPVEGNLLKGPDYLIGEYQIKNPTVEKMFNLVKSLFGEEIYDRYMKDYEHLMLRYAGLVNNKYFWKLSDEEIESCVYLDENNEAVCVIRSLDVEDGEVAFYNNTTIATNKAFLVTETLDKITLDGLRGDVNHDGDVNIKDVSDLIDRLLGNEANSCPYCSDVNCDNDVNIKDVSDLIDILLNRGADTHVDTPTPDPEGGE